MAEVLSGGLSRAGVTDPSYKQSDSWRHCSAVTSPSRDAGVLTTGADAAITAAMSIFAVRRFADMFIRGTACLLLASIVSAVFSVAAHAHEPFDFSSRAVVDNDRIEITSTMGNDAARQFFTAAGYSPSRIAEVLRALGPDTVVEHDAAVANHFYELRHDGQPLPARSVTSRSEGMEIIVVLTYPRPAAGVLDLRATGYDGNAKLQSGSLLVTTADRKPLGSCLLSAERTALQVRLPPVDATETPPVVSAKVEATAPVTPASAASPAPAAPARPSFGGFFTLGVEHILLGIDHLLFLVALLIGVKRLGDMLGIITCFTLAHSVTLALAATNVVALSPRIVEPLIAASIAIACIDNLARQDATRDRWWLAGGFGLIHGFGFAGALRATGLGEAGAGFVVPLLAFNLGVEAGQIGVAAVFLPVLFALRRWSRWTRHGVAVVSTLVIAVSLYWIWERLT